MAAIHRLIKIRTYAKVTELRHYERKALRAYKKRAASPTGEAT